MQENGFLNFGWLLSVRACEAFLANILLAYPLAHATPETWIEPFISLEGSAAGSRFGDAVACSKASLTTAQRSFVAVGAPNANSGQGAVYLYDSDSPSTVLQEIVSSNPGSDFHFGASIAFVNDINGDDVDDLVIGEPKSAPAVGQIHIFGSSITGTGLTYSLCQSSGVNPSHGTRLLGLRGPFMAPGYTEGVVVSSPDSGDTYGYTIAGACGGGMSYNSRFTSLNNGGRFGISMVEVPDAIMGSGDGGSDVLVGQPDFILASTGKVLFLGSDGTQNDFVSSPEQSYGESLAGSPQSSFLAVGSPWSGLGRGGVDIHAGSTGVVCRAERPISEESTRFGDTLAHLDTTFPSLFNSLNLATFASFRSEVSTGGSVALFAYNGSDCSALYQLNNCHSDPDQEQGKVLVGGSTCTVNRDGVPRAMLLVSSPGWNSAAGRVDIVTAGSELATPRACSAVASPVVTAEVTDTAVGGPLATPTAESQPTETPTIAPTFTPEQDPAVSPAATETPASGQTAQATATITFTPTFFPELDPKLTPVATESPISMSTPQPTATISPTPLPAPILIEPGQGDLPPPTVTVDGRNVTVTMPTLEATLSNTMYTKALRRLIKRGLSPTAAKSALESLEVVYIVTVKKLGPAGAATVMQTTARFARSSFSYRSRNNSISIRNLPPGNYVAYYRGQIATRSPSFIIGTTKKSPGANFKAASPG